jgi:ABC-2 type transport system ATP-binding protein
MPQNDALYDDLSGEENLAFFARLSKMPTQKITTQIDKVLNLTDLSNHRKKLVRNYSGGMKKRLSLAIALLADPDVLLLDEPTVGIDPMLRRIIWDQFHQMKANGKTIIISTHVMDEVTECDKAALLYDGQLIHYDVVDKLIALTPNGRIEELFLNAAQKKGMMA